MTGLILAGWGAFVKAKFVPRCARCHTPGVTRGNDGAVLGGYNGGSLVGENGRGERNMTMMAMTGTGRENGRMTPQVSLTSLERALLRLLVSGRTLEEAALPLGLPPADAERLLAGLQSRCGVSSLTRLLVLAVLNAWV